MSDLPIIRYENVSKRFTFTPEGSETILESLISLARRRRKQSRELWAVQNVSFDVLPGQALGIIGRNGSGKSTLMKLTARILRPTEGRVFTRGRISALLELGAGFHPDLTGRENIYLNGSVLGLDKATIDAAYDDIVAFSELGDFISMPVKHYSSGMYMRLGFSVAIHVRPDILIIDEILAVGDQAFQNKCKERIFDLKRQGTTIVMVTHELSAVRHLCTHLIWMDHGRVRGAGPMNEVVAEYLAYTQEVENSDLLGRNADGDFRRWGSGDIEITGVRFLDGEGRPQKVFQTGDSFTIEMAYHAHRPVPEPEFGLAIYREDGIQVNGPNNQMAGLQVGVVEGAGTLQYTVDSLPLLPGGYRVTAAIHDSHVPRAFDFHEQAYTFRVATGGAAELFGLVELPARWAWQPESAPAGALPVAAGVVTGAHD